MTVTLKEVFKEIFTTKEINENVEKNQVSDKKKEIGEIQDEARDILKKASLTSTSWQNVFNYIDSFRNTLLSDDRQDASATNSQIGFTLPLILLFSLVIETSMVMTAKDVETFINIMKLRFEKQEHLDALNEFVKTLDNYDSKE